ncbi:hypothetical protein [Arthrobacter humicola]
MIRRLHVSAAVPATASADEIAERLADRLARAIISAPGEGHIRYPSRGGHIAAFVEAVSGGTGDSWVFDSFAGARQLAPLTALRTLAERYAVPVVAVLRELSRTNALLPVLSRSSSAELARTWAACLAVPHPRMTAAESTRRLNQWQLDAEELSSIASADAMALLLVGQAIRRGQPAGIAVAAAAAIAATPYRSPGSATSTASAGDQATATPSSGLSATGSGAFQADGAPAFLLLSSFKAVGLGELTTAQRAAVLAAATRTSVSDPAVVLAAGPDDHREGDQRDGADISAVVQRALLADDRLGLARLEMLSIAGHLIVRDATSGIWLTVLEPGTPTETALVPQLAALPRSMADPDGASRARLVLDLSYLLSERDPAPESDIGLQRAVAVAARAGLGHFARRLPGFAASSLPYLSDRFLTPGGVILEVGESLFVQLPSPPLRVVLALAGLDRITVRVPWVPYAVTIAHADAA